MFVVATFALGISAATIFPTGTSSASGELESPAGCPVHETTEHCTGSAGGFELYAVNIDKRDPSEPGMDGTAGDITLIESCGVSSSSLICSASSTGYYVQTSITQTTDIPAQFTGCHYHADDIYCMAETDEVVIVPIDSVDPGNEAPEQTHCHFHAGVEHCIGPGESENESEPSCDPIHQDYSIGIRLGFLFGTLATSALGCFGPIFLAKFLPIHNHIITIFLNQFGTGVIISTAFAHLYTHASLMFGNPCLGHKLQYEATTSALVMAGLFVSLISEFVIGRILRGRLMHRYTTGSEEALATIQTKAEMVNVTIMEAGIVFHSVLIGVTTVVAGDSYYVTLATVILFHQFFEGIALGSRISCLGYPLISKPRAGNFMIDRPHHNSITIFDIDRSQPSAVPLLRKLIMAAAFSLTTPAGMAIGIGVLNSFNGNDPSTIITIGTFDAVSAGILIWVGIVEMIAHDWMHGGNVNSSDVPTTLIALFGLVAGMALMSFLGKWA